jgi:hypothetical protein
MLQPTGYRDERVGTFFFLIRRGLELGSLEEGIPTNLYRIPSGAGDFVE